MALTVVNQWTGTAANIDAEIPTFPTAQNWLIATICCRVIDGSKPVLNLGDPARNGWTLLASDVLFANASNTSAQVQVEVWACPAVRYDGWPYLPVYAAATAISASDVGSVCMNVIEVSGFANGTLTVDSVTANTANLTTSMSIGLPTPAGGANCLMLGVAATDNGTPSAITNTGSGFTGLTQVSTTNPNLVMTSQWRTGTAAATASWSSGATNVNWAALAVAIRETGNAPTPPQPAWPATQLQIGLGYNMSTPLPRVWWTDQTSRYLSLSGDRGIQAELGTVQQGQADIVIRNDDGAYSPRAAAAATASADGTITTLLIPDSQAGAVSVGDFFRLVNSATPLPSPVFSDGFESGGLSNWPTLIGAVSASTAAAYSGTYGARVNPGGGVAGQIATSTTKWTQGVYTCALIRAKLRFNTLPTTTTADVFTLQDALQTDNFDLYYNNTTGTLWFDLKGATAWTDTGITPVVGRWYDIQAIVYYGASTYTAQVMIDGRVFPLLSSPGETASFVRSLHIGTSSTGKTYQFDVDDVSVTVATGLLSFGQGSGSLKELTVFQVAGKASSGGTTTVTFKRADGTGGALAPVVTGDQYAGVGIDLYMPYRLLKTIGSSTSAKTYIAASGWLRDLPMSFDGAHWSQVAAHASDAVEALATPYPTVLRGEILRRQPTHYWPCDDPQGVTYAANASGVSSVALNQTASKFGTGANGTAQFGVSTQDVDLGSGVAYSVAGDPGTGWHMTGQTSAELATEGWALVGTGSDFPPISGGVTICGITFRTSAEGTTATGASVDPTLLMVRNTDPGAGAAGSVIKVSYNRSTTAVAVTVWDKTTRASTQKVLTGVGVGNVWALSFNQTSWTLYGDGGVAGSGSCNLVGSFTMIDVAGEADQFVNGRFYPGLYSHIAVFGRRLTTAEVNAIYSAAWNAMPVAHETTSQRIQRRLGVAGWQGPRVVNATPDALLGDPAPSGSVIESISELAGDEDSLAFTDAASQVQYRNRMLAYQQTARATLGDGPGEIPYQPGEIYDFNPTYIYNTVSTTNAGSTVVAVDETSAARYGSRAYARTTNYELAYHAWDMAWWWLARYAYPQQRVGTITVSAAATSDPARWAFVCGVEIGDLVTVTRRPIGQPVISLRCRVIGVRPAFAYGTGGVSAEVTLTLAAAPPQVGIANDPVYGVVGATVLGA